MQLSVSQREFMATAIRIMEAKHANAARRLFYQLFPDEDTRLDQVSPILDSDIIYAREKYQKHLEFFRAGAKYRERCVMAANRCITPWTWLQTPAGEALSAEVWTSEDAGVLAWADGSECAAQAQHGILKCIEPAFRLVLDNGQFFDCTRKHRVLTIEGWLSLDRLVSRSSGLRSWHRREDYQASCAAGGYLGDRPLRDLGGIDLASLLPQDDAQERAPLVFDMTDEVERRLQHSRAYPQADRLSSRDDLIRCAGLFALFSGASSAQSRLSLSEGSQSDRRLAEELGARLRSFGAPLRDQSEADRILSGLLSEGFGGEGRSTARHGEGRGDPQWRSAQVPGCEVQEFASETGHIQIFFPCDHPELVGGQTIAAIVPLGLQPIIDANVPDLNNYKAAGVYHHNTGKTFSMGGYELTAHLTGQYPDWWEGRRYKRPIRAWAAGKTNETTRDILQATLLGPLVTRGSRRMVTGTGLIPGNLVAAPQFKQGVQDFIDTVKVKHVSGGWSTLGFKSFQQGRGSFEGTAQHVILLDEEVPADIYGECLIRTATTHGILMLTFTPLDGMTEVVMQFMPEDMRPGAD